MKRPARTGTSVSSKVLTMDYEKSQLSAVSSANNVTKLETYLSLVGPDVYVTCYSISALNLKQLLAT